MPSHATQENVVFLTAIMVDHMNKSPTLIKTWMDFVITLNLPILLTDTFMCDGDGLPAPHCTTKWTLGNEQWFKTATNSQNFSLARQGEETGCTLRTARLKTVSCQQPHTLVTSRAWFQQVGDRPDS